MDVGIRFERWQRRPEFSLAIFRLKRFDCARSSGRITRTLIMKSFVSWPKAEPCRNQNNAFCSNSASAGSPLAQIARPRSSWLTSKVCTSGCWRIAARVQWRWQSSARCELCHCFNFGRRGRALARAAKHPIRNILLGVAGGAFGGLRMSGWNPIGGGVGGIVGGIVAAVESLC